MTETPDRRFDLASLLQVPLPETQQQALDRTRVEALGAPSWRVRKRLELQKLFALEQIAPRLTVRAADVTTSLRVAVALQVPVACWPEGSNDLVLAEHAELVLHYPEEILRTPLPGHAIVEILAPREVFHANVSPPRPGVPQRLCLGASVPRGLPLVEALLAAYAAFSMQSLAIDEADPAGLMNAASAGWWQANLDRTPLSDAPFLAPSPAPAHREDAP